MGKRTVTEEKTLHEEYDEITERLAELEEKEFLIREETHYLILRQYEIVKQIGWKQPKGE
jgi:hypothetical protein